jgi:hypothetical protein
MTDLLVAKSDGSLLHTRPVGPRSSLVIGRSPTCHVVVPNERASRHHAVVFEFTGEWYAVDLDSTAGLQIEAGPCRLHHFTEQNPWVRMGPVVLWIDGDNDRRRATTRSSMPIEQRREPAVRTRCDFVDPPPPPPATDAPSVLVGFQRRSDGDIRTLDLAGADRLMIGGSPDCDVILPGDPEPMRALVFRLGNNWAVVDLNGANMAEEAAGHRRLTPGVRWNLGSVEAFVLTPESACSQGKTDAEPSGLEGLDVPDLGSIFATRPDKNGGGDPRRPRNP